MLQTLPAMQSVAAQDVYDFASEAARKTAGSFERALKIPLRPSPTRPSPLRSAQDGYWAKCIARFNETPCLIPTHVDKRFRRNRS